MQQILCKQPTQPCALHLPLATYSVLTDLKARALDTGSGCSMDRAPTDGDPINRGTMDEMQLPGRLRSLQRRTGAIVVEQLGTSVLGAVDTAVMKRWDMAISRAAATEGAGTAERVKIATRALETELAMAGAATGGAAALPGVGTAAAVGMSAVELGWITVRLADLILTIAVIHGHGKASVEERRAWILSVLAWGEGAAAGFTKLAGEMGKGLGGKAVTKIPTTALRSINKALGRTIVTKYGTKRGAIALGRALPFGIGAAIGAGANYLGVHAVGKHADQFFRQLPYS